MIEWGFRFSLCRPQYKDNIDVILKSMSAHAVSILQSLRRPVSQMHITEKHNFCSATRLLDSEHKDLEKGVGRRKAEGEGQRWGYAPVTGVLREAELKNYNS